MNREGFHNSTRVSLLIRLRNTDDMAAWEEFESIYGPMLYRYCRARGLAPADAEDVRADCYEVLVRQLPSFEYDREKGGFKAWLHTIAIRRIIDQLRRNKDVQPASAVLQRISSGEQTIDEIWENEWRQHHLRVCMDHARPQVSDQTWTIFERLLLNEATVDQVCEELNVSANLVYKARARVLDLIRAQMQYLCAE